MFGRGIYFVIRFGRLYCHREKEKVVDLPEFYWQGVVVAYRIPKPVGAMDISQYLE